MGVTNTPGHSAVFAPDKKVTLLIITVSQGKGMFPFISVSCWILCRSIPAAVKIDLILILL